MQAEGYGSVNRRIRLRKLKNMTAQVKEDVKHKKNEDDILSIGMKDLMLDKNSLNYRYSKYRKVPFCRNELIITQKAITKNGKKKAQGRLSYPRTIWGCNLNCVKACS